MRNAEVNTLAVDFEVNGKPHRLFVEPYKTLLKFCATTWA